MVRVRLTWVFACLALSCATAEPVDDEGAGGAAGGGGDAGSSIGGSSGDGGGWPTGGGGTGSSASGGSGGGWPSGGSGGTGSAGTGATGGSGGTTSSGGTGGSGGGGATGGSGGTGGSSGACAGSSTCASATDVGTVSGDSGSASASSKGSGSKFIKVRVTEDNSSVIGNELTLQAVLDVPTSADYDLYAYVNTTSDTTPCGSAAAKSAQSGGIGANEQLKLNWGEGTVANGSDDGRWVVIEVRHKAGPCDSGTQWTLTVTGNV